MATKCLHPPLCTCLNDIMPRVVAADRIFKAGYTRQMQQFNTRSLADNPEENNAILRVLNLVEETRTSLNDEILEHMAHIKRIQSLKHRELTKLTVALDTLLTKKRRKKGKLHPVKVDVTSRNFGSIVKNLTVLEAKQAIGAEREERTLTEDFERDLNASFASSVDLDVTWDADLHGDSEEYDYLLGDSPNKHTASARKEYNRRDETLNISALDAAHHLQSAASILDGLRVKQKKIWEKKLEKEDAKPDYMQQSAKVKSSSVRKSAKKALKELKSHIDPSPPPEKVKEDEVLQRLEFTDISFLGDNLSESVASVQQKVQKALRKPLKKKRTLTSHATMQKKTKKKNDKQAKRNQADSPKKKKDSPPKRTVSYHEGVKEITQSYVANESLVNRYPEHDKLELGHYLRADVNRLIKDLSDVQENMQATFNEDRFHRDFYYDGGARFENGEVAEL